MKNNFRPIAMKCSQEQFKQIKPILIDNGLTIDNIYDSRWGVYCYLVNNYRSVDGSITNVNEYDIVSYGREIFEKWNQDTFLQYCGIKTNKTMEYKLTVPVTDVLKIHSIACTKWKEKIKLLYLPRIDENQNISFAENEIDTMFSAATAEQTPVLRKIFGEKKQVIDYDKLKTGSKVMIKETNRHCNGFENIDVSKPVDIVFYKTPHIISVGSEFRSRGTYDSYTTFHQNGKFVLFSAHLEIDYITEVIEY
jgi:hypothetical protein